MNYLIILLFISIPFTTPRLVDIRGNVIDLRNDKYLLVFLSGWNCKDCIRDISIFLEYNNVDKNLIYYVIESDNSIYTKLNLKKLIEEGTDHYNSIVYNPRKVVLNDQENSLFLRFSTNHRTPAIIIKSDKTYFYSYDSLFKFKDSVTLDFKGMSILKRDFTLE